MTQIVIKTDFSQKYILNKVILKDAFKVPGQFQTLSTNVFLLSLHHELIQLSPIQCIKKLYKRN